MIKSFERLPLFQISRSAPLDKEGQIGGWGIPDLQHRLEWWLALSEAVRVALAPLRLHALPMNTARRRNWKSRVNERMVPHR